jgi:hypothetical protein
MTYCGPLGEGSSTLIAWLSAAPGVHDIHPGANPATWMLVRTPAGLLHPQLAAAQASCRVWPCSGRSSLRSIREFCCCSLQEVTGGSQAISAKASDVDFPTYYKVICARHARQGTCHKIQLQSPILACILTHTTQLRNYLLHATQDSQLAKDNEAEAAQLAAELPQKHQPLTNKTRYATPANMQMRQLMRRFILVYWRSPAYNVG